jgi:hypothetical protein
VTPEEEPGGIIGYRLTAVEKGITSCAQGLADLRKHIDDRFEALGTRMGSLEYIRKDVYDVRHEELRAMLREEIEARKSADESNHSLAMWSLGSLITAIGLVSILIGVLRLVAS